MKIYFHKLKIKAENEKSFSLQKMSKLLILHQTNENATAQDNIYALHWPQNYTNFQFQSFGEAVR